MQLTHYTDYSLRVLIYLTLKPGISVTITEIAAYYKISRNHLVKVVNHLANAGYIRTTRGKGGGLRLARAPAEICIGDVVRKMEPNFNIVECFNPHGQYCEVESLCALKKTLGEAMSGFLAVLDKYSLADAVIKDARHEFPVSLQR